MNHGTPFDANRPLHPREPASHRRPFVVAANLTRVFAKGSNSVQVFSNLSFTVHEGEFVALLGPSGSGKSTILNLLAGFDQPTAGAVSIDGVTVGSLPERELTVWRSQSLGFIFQSRNLVSLLTAVENVEFPLQRMKMSGGERRDRAMRALSIVGLAERAKHFPSELSGGEEQRVAIACALVTDPKLIIADEPTGNLDADSASNIMEVLRLLVREHKKTVLLVTHDPVVAACADRRLMLSKGVLADDGGGGWNATHGSPQGSQAPRF
jgi:putative ABC transport system ATP-binding protein